jgi:hypothetical protein
LLLQRENPKANEVARPAPGCGRERRKRLKSTSRDARRRPPPNLMARVTQRRVERPRLLFHRRQARCFRPGVLLIPPRQTRSVQARD